MQSNTDVANGSQSARSARSDRQATTRKQFRKTAPLNTSPIDSKLAPISEKKDVPVEADPANLKASELMLLGLINDLKLEIEVNNKKLKHLEQTSQIELRKIHQTFTTESQRISKLEDTTKDLSNNMQKIIKADQGTPRFNLAPARSQQGSLSPSPKKPAIFVTVGEIDAKKYLEEASLRGEQRLKTGSPGTLASVPTRQPSTMSLASSGTSSEIPTSRFHQTKYNENLTISQKSNSNSYIATTTASAHSVTHSQGTFTSFIPAKSRRYAAHPPIAVTAPKIQAPFVPPAPQQAVNVEPNAVTQSSAWCCLTNSKNRKVTPSINLDAPPAHSSPATNNRRH